MKTSDFDYHLPVDLIAQEPIEPRDSSRLLLLHRNLGKREHTHFRNIEHYLRPGDLLVVNRSRVFPARLYGRKVRGGKIELLLLERTDAKKWKVLVGGKGLSVGKHVELENGIEGEIVEDLGGGQRLLALERAIDDDLEKLGEVPLPPYIHEPLRDRERYQTVYARERGSAAAPTAGLHFTPELIERLKAKGMDFAEVTLHIGLDTFSPVTEKSPLDHQIHTEWASLSGTAADLINQARSDGGRIIAVGTTSVRVLETAARRAVDHKIEPFEGRTDLYILPGFEFRAVDALVTNFHLPRSTLLMLVSAFAGRELILETYREAIAQGYRFYSFGDAMLIL
ncbi:MAG: tRNA preQ1(34) S-adenosylmethionine ribosyltransferase-isomerase QueA [Anaerolineales bacterium]